MELKEHLLKLQTLNEKRNELLSMIQQNHIHNSNDELVFHRYKNKDNIWFREHIQRGINKGKNWNSLLEEFFFRLIGCIKLGEYSSKKFAYIFSSLLFALYHIGMIGRSFPISLTIISVICLFILGVIFNHVNEKNKNIFNSWFVHMFVDFAIMTIGYINM